VETLHGNNWPRERIVGKPVGIVQDALAPSEGILDAESVFDLRKDIKEQAVRMRRPSNVHTAIRDLHDVSKSAKLIPGYPQEWV
jgi:hypothetical protein